MAGWGTRFVLLCVICCFLVNVCKARGGRGGGGRGRYRGGAGGGGSLSSDGGEVGSGVIVGIVCGVIGLVGFIVVLYHLIKTYCVWTDTSANKYRGTNGTVIIRPSSIIATSSQPPGIANPTTPPPRRMISTPSTISNDTLYNDDNHTSNVDAPPSYESVVNQKEDLPSYSGQRNGNRSYSPASSRFPAESLGSSYPSRNPSDVFYLSSSSPRAGFTEDGVNGSRDVRTLTASGSNRGQGNVSFPASEAGTYV